jgi:hypothetical protein
LSFRDGILPFDVLKQVFTSLHKETVLETLVIGSIPRFVEVIHIQLSDETREVVMFEVLGKNFVRKHIHLLNNESISFLIPTNDIISCWIIYNIVSLYQE